MAIRKLVDRHCKSGRPLTHEEKWMVHQVFKEFKRAKERNTPIIVSDPYSLTSQYTGVSRVTVANIVKSIKDTGDVPVFHSPGNRNQSLAIPSLVEGRIREFVFEQHRQGAVCNTKHIKVQLEDEFHIKIEPRILQRHLNRMGFEWSRIKNKSRSLHETNPVRQQRHDYLYELRENNKHPSEERYQVVYLDESFLHHHHAARFSWLSGLDFIERPSGKGRRWCFIHAMTEDGLIEGAFLIFEAKHSKGDYHQQFDYQVFHRWFEKQ